MSEHAPTDGAKAVSADPLLGQEVGGTYRLVRVIGTGGMGTVYEAQHLSRRRRCAVKVLLRSLQDDPTYLERFRREADVTSRLKNRHICEVLDFNHLPDGSPYLAMEFLEGEDLAARLRKRPLNAREVVPILDGVGSALAAAHRVGVVHRDVKPANIFISKTPEGTELPKLLDFGAAKRQGGRDANLTTAGQVLGSVWYVSPEQARGQELDTRTDIFSLGIVLYEALSGRNPFEAATPTETLFKIVSDPPVPLRSLVPALPPAIDEVMARALAKRREDRYQTVIDFVEAAIAVLDPAYRRKNLAPRQAAEGVSPLGPPASRATPVKSVELPLNPTLNVSPSALLLRAMAERSLLTAAQLEQALAWEKSEGEAVLDRLVAANMMEERVLLRFLAGSSGYKYITQETLAKSRLPAPAVARLPAALAESRCIAPLAYDPFEDQLTIAVPEPSQELLAEVRAASGVSSIQGILALRGTIRAAIRRFYPADALSPAALAEPSSRTGVAPPTAPALGPATPAVPDAAEDTAATPVGEDEHDTLPPGLRAKEARPATEPVDREREDEPSGAPQPPDAAIIEPLQSAHLLEPAGLKQAMALWRERGGYLGDAILRLSLVKEVDFLRTFAELYGTRFVKSDKVVKVTFDSGLLEQLPARVAEELRVLPFARNAANGEVHVIAAVPLHPEIEGRVRKLAQARAVTVYLATPGAVQAALRRWYYGDLSALGEVTPNGAGPGPMRPRTSPSGDSDPADPTARREGPSLKTVVVAVDDTRVASVRPPPERLAPELQRRLGLGMEPSAMLDALLELWPCEAAALVPREGPGIARGLRAQMGEMVPRARVEAALSNRLAIHTEDATADALLGATRLVREKNLKHALTLPLLGRFRVHGVLHVDSSKPFAAQDQKDLTGLAEVLALRLDDEEALAQARAQVRKDLAVERFVPPALREAARSGALPVAPEGQLVQAALACVQLREPDESGTRLSAPELVNALNAAWESVTTSLQSSGGAVVGFQNGQLLVLWSPMLGGEGEALRALEAAQALQKKVAKLTVAGKPLGLRIGIHAGLVTLAALGPNVRQDFGVLGSTARIAARLATVAQEGQLLLSEGALERIGPRPGLKPVPQQPVHEAGTPIMAFLVAAP